MHDRSGKFNFDDIYDLEDPRGYFGALREFDYRIPAHGSRVFSLLAEAKLEAGLAGSGRASVLDLCCSYGINAALLKHDVDLDDLYERYGSEEVSGLSSVELAESDAAFFRGRGKKAAPSVAGLDTAGNAVGYGLRAGLLDAGFAENLEEAEPTDGLKEAAARVDLLTVTGGISYITEITFGRLISAARSSTGRLPWVAVFVLRTIPYAPISETLSGYGLLTEKLRGHTFDQRRFASREEREFTLRTLADMGIDPSGKEDAGTYHADFYLSRPAEEAENMPVEDLLAPVLEPDSSG